MGRVQSDVLQHGVAPCAMGLDGGAAAAEELKLPHTPCCPPEAARQRSGWHLGSAKSLVPLLERTGSSRR